MRDAGDASRLVSVGRPGWLYDEIYARVRTLDLVSSVRFIEAPPVDDLVGLYNGAAALIMPSFYEGFGLPPLEAMQCGTPTIVSNRASLPEVVGHAGLLVVPDDPQALAEACLAVLSDAELRQRMRQLGLQQASNFTWQLPKRQCVYAPWRGGKPPAGCAAAHVEPSSRGEGPEAEGPQRRVPAPPGLRSLLKRISSPTLLFPAGRPASLPACLPGLHLLAACITSNTAQGEMWREGRIRSKLHCDRMVAAW